MTYAMWCIVTGLVVIFGVSLLHYRRSIEREQKALGEVGRRQGPGDER